MPGPYRRRRGPASSTACDHDPVAIQATHFSDPACPWAYSASPAHTVLRWRYGEQLRWRLVLIGLTEDRAQYERRGYTPAGVALGYHAFRRYGMPFRAEPKRSVAATSRACRAIVATRLRAPELEPAAFRALQLSQFTTDRLLDDDDDLRATLAQVEGLEPDAIVGAIDDQPVIEAYERDRAEARSAAATPTEAQGRAASTDGPVRYTAPSLIFERDGRRLEAGGFQPIEAYDVLIANLEATLERRPPPDGPRELLEAFPDGLTTQEVAAVLARRNDAPDRVAAEHRLIELLGSGGAVRIPLADDALWRPA
jgi:2-hydroxychromene-2-carboxylate isomerase